MTSKEQELSSAAQQRQNIDDALIEARDILTKGHTEHGDDDHVIEESTSIQVVQSGDAGDPVEITVSRSTILSQTNSDDEDDSHKGYWSDSDFPRSRKTSTCLHHLHSSASDEHLSGDADDETHRERRHTIVRYRRRAGQNWSLVDESAPAGVLGDVNGDDGRLQIDVKEECCDEQGSHVLRKRWEVTWKVQSFEILPDWLKDNEYLYSGHRPPLPDFASCFKSIFSVHTETGNIWTHLIGCVLFFLLAAWFLTSSHIQSQEKLVFSFFFVGAIFCLGMSFAFHTLSCHSAEILRVFSKLDYVGISVLIVGSFIPWIFYGFYCRREPKISYIAMIVVLGIGAMIVSLWDKFSESRYRPLRAGVFVGLGLSGVVPTVHFIITDGVRSLFEENSFHWLLLMAALYLLGAALYATRTPERFFPGKCDYLFQSHQIFHLCVVVAAFVHYYGISEMAVNRLSVTCPVDPDPMTPFAVHGEL